MVRVDVHDESPSPNQAVLNARCMLGSLAAFTALITVVHFSTCLTCRKFWVQVIADFLLNNSGVHLTTFLCLYNNNMNLWF